MPLIGPSDKREPIYIKGEDAPTAAPWTDFERALFNLLTLYDRRGDDFFLFSKRLRVFQAALDAIDREYDEIRRERAERH